MPVEIPYEPFDFIVIRFMDGDATTDRKEWHAKVVALLDLIRSIPLGEELMDDMASTKYKVWIQPALAGSNQCAASNNNCFVLLRQAIEDFGSTDFATELRTTLDRAARSMLTVEGIARRIMGGMGGATVQTSRNVARPSGQPVAYETRKLDRKGAIVTKKVAGTKQVVWVDAKLTAESLAELIHGLANGTRKRNELTARRNGRLLSDDLLRCFYLPNATAGDEYLRRGVGSSSTIMFKPFVEESCWLDEHISRPPGVGLVHELIHAWRNMHGLRVFKDKEKFADAPTPDDEIMTTGFPPYQWEKFTENMFRTLWAVNQVGAIDAPGTMFHGHQPLRHKY